MLLLPLYPPPTEGQPEGQQAAGVTGLAVRAWLAADTVRVSLRFDSRHSAEVLSSLRGALKSQVTYQLRLYRRQNGRLAFLGDRLVLARELIRIASLDLIDDHFLLLDETGQREYADQEAFLEDFFSLRDFPMGALSAAEGSECYVLARGRLEPVRVVPPLDIIRLLTRLTSFSSPWVRAPIERQIVQP